MSFDPEKDRKNRAKHGVSLARWSEMEMIAVIVDDRFDYGEERYRAFGRIEGLAYCLTFSVRDGNVRSCARTGRRSEPMKKPAEKAVRGRVKSISSRTVRADSDNPFWTGADFAAAGRPEDVLPPAVLAQFPKHRGPQKAPTKVPVSIRLSSDVLGYFKRKGKGWQTRIDDALRKVAGLKR